MPNAPRAACPKRSTCRGASEAERAVIRGAGHRVQSAGAPFSCDLFETLWT